MVDIISTIFYCFIFVVKNTDICYNIKVSINIILRNIV